MSRHQLELAKPSWDLPNRDIHELCVAAGHRAVANLAKAGITTITMKDGTVVEEIDARRSVVFVLIQPFDHPYCNFLVKAHRARTTKKSVILFITEYETRRFGVAFATAYAAQLEALHPELSTYVEDSIF